MLWEEPGDKANKLSCTCILIILVQDDLLWYSLIIQWNPSKTDTIGTNNFVHCSKVSLAQGLVVDHAPPTIAASYDKA